MSEQPYAPFSGTDATCPKCGGDMAREYQPAGTRYVRSVGPVLGHGPEWLLRRCADCGHTWAEMCADAYPETALQERRT